MKAKKKPLGIKHKIREERKREERIAVAVTVAILIVIISVSGFLINSMLNQPSTNQPVSSTSEPKAAIVDQLSLTLPNQTFIQTATTILKQAGYTVDYYPGEEVTVEFYRNLPTYVYKIIIFRVHTTERGAFFTSEAYSSSAYIWEQLNGQIWKVSYNGSEPFYFGISPSFIKSYMNGRLDKAVIVAMGCYTLKFNDMAEAFVEKGAKVYIGWSGSVLASHTDLATTHLLQHLVAEKQTIKNSIIQTMKEVGPDPAYKYKSVLLALPEEAWDHTI